MLEFASYLAAIMAGILVLGVWTATFLKPRLRRRYERRHHLSKRAGPQ